MINLSAEARQRIVVIWFTLLTMVAVFNFYSNITDRNMQTELATSYRENKDRYESSINEHQTFRDDINYLKGRTACGNDSR
jgi:hypothetical protein